MIPSRDQFRKWSLPTKWSYWAAVIGIPAGILSLGLAVQPFFQRDSAQLERNRLIFQVAQELRYNHEWLSDVAIAVKEKALSIPIGSLKAEALMVLATREYQRVTQHAYGEKKHIYQETLKLKDLSNAFGSPKTSMEVDAFNRRSTYHLHDILFLNDFLHWYLRPLIQKELEPEQLQSLGWRPFLGDRFHITGVKKFSMKRFVYEGRPIDDFSLYILV